MPNQVEPIENNLRQHNIEPHHENLHKINFSNIRIAFSPFLDIFLPIIGIQLHSNVTVSFKNIHRLGLLIYSHSIN